jgi:hypothetical protein
MKRSVLALLVMLMLVEFSADSFGDLNIKAGLQSVGGRATETDNRDRDYVERYSNIGIAVTCEWLIDLPKISEILRIGAGCSYVVQEKLFKKGDISGLFFSYFPIYFTLQVNPFISSFDEYLHGIFVKANIGYNILFDIVASIDREVKNFHNGGVYYGLSSGYEFRKGWIAGIGYNVYKGVQEEVNYTHSAITFDVGYKFKRNNMKYK